MADHEEPSSAWRSSEEPSISSRSANRKRAAPQSERFNDLWIAASLTVIDRSYPLESAAEAHAYVDTGRKRRNVVLTVRRTDVR
jgi:hypothetical protein